MTLRNNFITVTLRSHLTPSSHIEGFEPGKKLQIKLAGNTTVNEFTRRFFFPNTNRIGLIAVNGKMAKEEIILQEGDTVDIYSLLPGG